MKWGLIGMTLEKLENIYFAYDQVLNTFLLLETVYKRITKNFEDLVSINKTLTLKETFISLSFKNRFALIVFIVAKKFLV